MDGALGLLLAAMIVGILVYTKPNFFWNSYKMQRARQHLTEAEAEPLAYGFILLVMLVACVMLLF